ncbi:hypothetical protein ACFOLC_00615 [Lysobacter cavernae]|uniref:Uncharacterized protein n=1 Tax=Lysobacter cavernae TaxID=1685901 RepID=A0ABV7RLA4_9GAMM
MDTELDILQRFWTDLVARSDGPMTFRFFLQPTMAFIAALHDGIKDAKAGRAPYFQRLVHGDKTARLTAFREGFTAVTRVLLLGVGMDVIYQYKMYSQGKQDFLFYPTEALVIVVLLAFVPYLLLRGPIKRIATWWFGRKQKAG